MELRKAQPPAIQTATVNTTPTVRATFCRGLRRGAEVALLTIGDASPVLRSEMPHSPSNYITPKADIKRKQHYVYRSTSSVSQCICCRSHFPLTGIVELACCAQTTVVFRQTHPKSNNIAGASSAASSLIRFCIPDIGPDQGLVVGAGAVPLRSTAVEGAADGRVSGPKPGTYTPCGGEAVGAGGAGS